MRPRSASSPATTPPPAPEPTTTTSKRSLIDDAQVRPVLRQPRGERAVEVDLLPRAGRLDAGGDEVAVERLDRERADPQEVGRARPRREVAVGERRERGEAPLRASPPACARAARRRRRRSHARRSGDDRVADTVDHASRLGVQYLQIGHGPMIRTRRAGRISGCLIYCRHASEGDHRAVRGSMDDREGRGRRGHRLGRAEPAREAQRDEPDLERGDGRGAARARRRRRVRRARAHRRRRRLVGRHGSQGVLPRGRRRARARAAPRARDAAYWQWRLLRTYAKPTIAMVNGWCFGGAFTPLVACDLAIAADEATFGLSEINWGIPPGSVVSKALSDTVGARAGLLYVMTGRTFDGQRAAEMGLVNASVPRARCAPRSSRWRASCSRRTRSFCVRRDSATSTPAR